MLLHGQLDTQEDTDKKFVVDTVHKSIHEALKNHNEMFLNTLHNIMKEVFYGAPIDQIRPAYFNIPHPSTQGNNIAGTSQQLDGDQAQQPPNGSGMQAPQNPSGQAQQSNGVNTHTVRYTPGSSLQHVMQ